MAGQAANQIGAEKKCTAPPVTMATDKGRCSRAELGKREEGKEGGEQKQEGKERLLASSSSVLPVLNT